MRAIIALIIILLAQSISAEYSVSSEYRSDSFEDEEKERVFLRERAGLFIDQARGVGCTVIRFPSEKRGSFTWFAKASSDVGLSLCAGNFYTQMGSGLLSGRMKPYIPDPFAEEKEIIQKNVFKECTSGYSAYTYHGLALSFCPEEEGFFKGLYVFGSQAPRYYRDDYDDSTDSSYSSILGNTQKKGGSREPVSARSAGALVSVEPLRELRFELSSVYCDLRDGQSGPVEWSAGNNGSCKSSMGLSLFGSYNDGILSAFSEYARNFQRWNDSGNPYRRKSYAWQGRFGIQGERVTLTVSGKKIAKDYYLPYFSAMGKRTPSEGIFMESTIRPYRFFSFRLYSASDKNTAVTTSSPEQMPSNKESARIDITPEGKGSLFYMYRQTGDALMCPKKRQSRSGLEYRFVREFSAHTDFTEQRGKNMRSRSIRGGANFIFWSIFYGSMQGGYSWIDKDDTLYQDALALDAESSSWMSVRERSWSAATRFGINTTVFDGAVRYAVQGEGKHLYHTRFECRASGRW
jgi:hypothetical protein